MIMFYKHSTTIPINPHDINAWNPRKQFSLSFKTCPFYWSSSPYQVPGPLHLGQSRHRSHTAKPDEAGASLPSTGVRNDVLFLSINYSSSA
ncbi:hypothetical protein TWF173_007012 [Orbilia oligospora]|nr:hypothetical protein TWF173_007012 [Orbilia oligospora]